MSAADDKLSGLKRLGAQRRAFSVPEGCLPVGAFHGGRYESDFVSPWTISACNVDADLFVVLQDWCGSDYLSGPFNPLLAKLGHDPQLPTNRNLKALLYGIGRDFSDVFGTNAFPFVKSGAMDADIENKALRECVERFVLPQVDIVQPKVTVLMGKTVYNAVCKVLGRKAAPSLDAAIATPIAFGSTLLVASVHTGNRIHIHRGWDRAVDDWKWIGARLA